MNCVPVDPVPITPTRLPAMSRSFGHALVCTRVPATLSRPAMSEMLLFASSPSALTRYRAVSVTPVDVVTVHSSSDSSNTAPVTPVFSWMSRARSKRSTTCSR